MKKMDIGDIRPREVIEVEEDKDQVQVSGSHNQNQASSSSQEQDQQVASTSSQPNNTSIASNQVQVLQPTNIARDHPLDSIIGDISRGVQTRSRLE
jgi:transcriptional accessory protein Tex/SPT6